MTSPPVTRRTRLPGDARRALILRVAGTLFARHGYAATRLEDIAAAAEVTKPVVYRHFASKQALYLALLERHEADLPGFLAGADPADPAAVMTVLGHWLDYVRENQHAWVMLFRDSTGDAAIQAVRVRVSARARETMAGFVAAAGAVPPDQVEATAEVLRSGLAGLALWWIDHPDAPRSDVIATAVRMTAPAFIAP
jgi:AcrR family transcriptional regulator